MIEAKEARFVELQKRFGPDDKSCKEWSAANKIYGLILVDVYVESYK